MFDTPDEPLAKIRLGEDSVFELKSVRFLGKAPVGESGRARRGSDVEARGEGVPLILAAGRKVSAREPLYVLHGDELKLTLFGRPDAEAPPQ